jgi:electron transport complex protein RnfG
MYRAIVGIGAFCALIIVTVFNTTAARIQDNRERALRQAIAEVMPAARSTLSVIVDDRDQLSPAEQEPPLPVFLGYDENNRLVGAAITAQGMGYQDIIRVLYAYSFEMDAITGFKILESKETPGLGDRVEKEPHFIANFEALDARLNAAGSGLANPIVTVKEGEKFHPWQVDGITGATITSVAIGNLLNRSAERWAPVLEREAEAFATRSQEQESP